MPKKEEERFLCAQADPFEGAKGKEKASACFVRNDGAGAAEVKRKMPGFPTHIVGTPTNRGKARRYASLCCNFKTNSSAAEAVKEKRRVMSDLKVRPPGAIQTLHGEKNGAISTGSEQVISVHLLGPGRDDAGHAGVGDELAHVLVGMNDDAQVHAVHGGIAIDDGDLALEIFRRDRQMGLLHGVQGALEPVDDFGFCGDGLLHAFFQVGGHFWTGHVQQAKISECAM